MERKPKVINWMYTGRCNLSCGFCYGKFNPDILSLEEKYLIVDKIAYSSIPKLIVTGGEPLVGEGIYDVIKHAKSRDIFVSLHTNGILLDEQTLNEIQGNVGRVSLVLEGSTDEINYEMRGHPGYLQLTTNLMESLNERGMPISVKTVATKKNIHDIPNMVPILAKYNPDVWLISQFRPMRKGKQNKEQYEIHTDELTNLKDALKGAPFEVAIRYSEERSTHPFFFLDSNGKVYTSSNNSDEEEFIGSIFDEEIPELWNKILKINPITDNYIENTWTVKPR